MESLKSYSLCNTMKYTGDVIMAISLRLSEDETILIKKYAKLHNVSISDLFRQAVMEKIEDEYDLSLFNKAMEEHQKDNITYTLDEVIKELD